MKSTYPASMRPRITSATAAAKTASSQKSDLMPRGSSRRALAARLEAAHRLEAFRDRRHFEAEGARGKLLELRKRVHGALRARIEIAPDPGLRGPQVLAVAGLVAHQEREPGVQQPQA